MKEDLMKRGKKTKEDSSEREKNSVPNKNVKNVIDKDEQASGLSIHRKLDQKLDKDYMDHKSRVYHK